MNDIKEIVKIYIEPHEAGDLVRCNDCDELALMQIGGTACGNCEGENLEWYDENKPEWTPEELDEENFICEFV